MVENGSSIEGKLIVLTAPLTETIDHAEQHHAPSDVALVKQTGKVIALVHHY